MKKILVLSLLMTHCFVQSSALGLKDLRGLLSHCFPKPSALGSNEQNVQLFHCKNSRRIAVHVGRLYLVYVRPKIGRQRPAKELVVDGALTLAAMGVAEIPILLCLGECFSSRCKPMADNKIFLCQFSALGIAYGHLAYRLLKHRVNRKQVELVSMPEVSIKELRPVQSDDRCYLCLNTVSELRAADKRIMQFRNCGHFECEPDLQGEIEYWNNQQYVGSQHLKCGLCDVEIKDVQMVPKDATQRPEVMKIVMKQGSIF